jgi:GH24 family phage-related lysozyme (muramidase)
VIDVNTAWTTEVEYESCQETLYKDIEGYPTTGCGNFMILSSMMALPWVRKSDGQPATAEEKQQDWNYLATLPKAMPALYYAQRMKLRLKTEDIKALFARRVSEFSLDLAGRVQDYDTMPHAAQLALLDMVFNLGPGRLIQKFPTFCKAIKARDWATAAAESHRHNDDESVKPYDASNKHERRQILVRDLLLSCVEKQTS